MLKKIIYSSGFLAIIPAVIIIFFLPAIGTKYKLQVEQAGRGEVNHVYTDIDSDSISEAFYMGKGTPYFYIVVQNNDLGVYDQWNFKDSIDYDLSDYFFGNYDNDRFKEIYAFTYKDDSLFLNINEFLDPDGLKSDRLYLTSIRVVNRKVTSTVFPAGFYDTNGDGFGELFFSIQTGFGLEPRRFYSYDIANNILRSNQFTGMAIQKPTMSDMDGDGRPEFFGTSDASGNYKTWSPFTDLSSWLMVIDDQLEFKFPPVEFPGLTNRLDIHAYTRGEFKGFMISHNTGSADTNVMKPRIMLYTANGKKIRERLYSDYGLNRNTQLVILREGNIDRIYLLGPGFIEVNDKLEVLKRIKSSFNSYFSILSDRH